MAELRVGVDARPAEVGSRRVVLSLDRIRAAAGATDRGVERTNRSFARARQSAFSLTRTLGLLGGALAVRTVGQYANAWQQATNRLRLATDSTEELVVVQEELFDVAQRTRNDIEGTVTLFQRLARSSDQLGISLQEVLDVTETVSQAITVSGVSAIEANAAIVQLGQGLASGALRGDELRSVLEQTPRLARAIADGLGITIGQLREFGQEGRLTAEAVIGALQGQADIIEAEFSQLAPTIGQGFTVLRNSLIRTVGILGETSGVTSGFAEALIDVARFVQGPLLQGIERFGTTASTAFGIVQDSLVRFDLFFDAFGQQSENVFESISRSFFNLPITIVTSIQQATVEVAAFLERTETRIRLFSNTVRGIFATLTGDDDAVDRLARQRVGLETELQTELLTIEQERLGFTLERTRLEDLVNERLREQAQLRATSTAGVDLTTSGEGLAGAAATKDQLEDIQKVIEDTRTPLQAYQAGLAELNTLYATGLLPTENYQRAIQELAQDFREADAAQIQYTEDLAAVADLYEATRTPLELYNAEVERLNGLLNRGLIDQELFARGVAAAREELLDLKPILTGIAEETGAAIQGAFADFLFDPFEDGLDGLVRSFSETLRRIAAELLAQEILKRFFGALGGLGGGFGSFATAVSGAVAGRQFGGPVNANQPVLVGERAPEVFVPKQSGQVLTMDQFQNQSAPAPVDQSVNITNVLDPALAIDAIQTNEGERAILNVIERNPQVVERALS